MSTIYVEPSGSCGGYTPCYSTIQAAIDAADSGTIIKIAQGTYNEDLTISRSVDVVLQWNTTFTAQSSSTTVTSMTISNGSVTVDKLVVQ